MLGNYVREEGVLTLEEAVQAITLLPASRTGLSDRGRIVPGFVADFVVFDPDTIADRSTFEQSWQLSEGVSHVIVGGELALADGKATAERAGRVLRRGSHGLCDELDLSYT